jgi:hypothetical protein
LGQVDYQGAIKKGFPIGSGEVESGNKSVWQGRLKIAGAWWKVENAKNDWSQNQSSQPRRGVILETTMSGIGLIQKSHF